MVKSRWLRVEMIHIGQRSCEDPPSPASARQASAFPKQERLCENSELQDAATGLWGTCLALVLE